MDAPDESTSPDQRLGAQVPLRTIVREWGRVGVTGFGGPPAHIALLRDLCVDRRGWLTHTEFEDAIAAANLLPGPASTQLAIFCAWRLRGWRGAIAGGFCFILPGLVITLALSALFLATAPPMWVLGVAAGAGAAVPAVAIQSSRGLAGASWRRAGPAGTARARWIGYAAAGAVASAIVGPWLVLVILACGLFEVVARRDGSGGSQLPGVQPTGPEPADPQPTSPQPAGPQPAGPQPGGSRPGGSGPDRPRPGKSRPGRPAVLALAIAAPSSVLLSVAWVAFKVGALSYGGGFVIIPLMQHDAVVRYGWMSAGQFLTAVAIGQITPGPVVLTVAVVGYAAAGIAGAFLGTAVAFAPSFAFVLAGGRHFGRLRSSARVQSFLTGAGPASIGAIAGAAVPLALALDHSWQYWVLAGAAVWLLAARRSVVSALLLAGAAGLVAALSGAAVALG